MFTSFFFRCIVVVAALRYLFYVLSCSCLRATFSTLTSYSLSINFSLIYTCRVHSASEGSPTKSSYAASSCSPSCALGYHMLIGVTLKNLSQFPSRSMVALAAGVDTYGAWLTKVFSSMIYVSIVFLSASCASVIVVIGVDIVS